MATRSSVAAPPLAPSNNVPRQPAKRLSLCFARYASMVQSILSLRKKVKINPLTVCHGALSESDLGRQHAQIF